jgi:hypothetical protein
MCGKIKIENIEEKRRTFMFELNVSTCLEDNKTTQISEFQLKIFLHLKFLS